MTKGNIVWYLHMDGSNPILYIVGDITVNSEGLPVVELCDFYTGLVALSTTQVNNIHVTKILPPHLCYEPYRGKLK